MKTVWVLLIGVFVLSGFRTIEQKTITGKVISAEEGIALPGVSVLLKGSIIGTVTNSDGEYQIKIPAFGETLIFSFIGLQTKEIVIRDQTLINVSLEEDPVQLSELAVSTFCFAREPMPLTGTKTAKRKKARRSRN